MSKNTTDTSDCLVVMETAENGFISIPFELKNAALEAPSATLKMYEEIGSSIAKAIASTQEFAPEFLSSMLEALRTLAEDVASAAEEQEKLLSCHQASSASEQYPDAIPCGAQDSSIEIKHCGSWFYETEKVVRLSFS